MPDVSGRYLTRTADDLVHIQRSIEKVNRGLTLVTLCGRRLRNPRRVPVGVLQPTCMECLAL